MEANSDSVIILLQKKSMGSGEQSYFALCVLSGEDSRLLFSLN